VDQEREPPSMGAGILGLQAEEDVKRIF